MMDEENILWYLRDDQAKEAMVRISRCATLPEFQQLTPQLQKEYVQEMYLEKMSMNQISRLTGMPKTTVIRTVRKIDPRLLTERQQLKFRESDDPLLGFDTNETW